MSRPLLRKIWRLPRLAVKRFVTTLLQVLLLINRPARLARSGFVLPTTALLVLMVLLTATALTYRAFTRSDMVVGQREQQVISNAATPAIDRAKAKIEFLFQDDPRFPSGVPSSDVLANLMLPSDARILNATVIDLPGAGKDPFTLPDEKRLDINNDGKLDNAWEFKADVNADGAIGPEELIVYSILVDDEGPAEKATTTMQSVVDDTKAKALVTRTGPLATTEATASCSGAKAESGWQVVEAANNSSLHKNFQINAFVANNSDVNRAFESYEFQQSRIADRANKWGAWFRYDLEIFPGPEFNWNGAMHTDGNLIVQNNLRSHMVSSHNSCVYSQKSSEITMGQFDHDEDGDFIPAEGDFQGQAIMSAMKFDNYTDQDVAGAFKKDKDGNTTTDWIEPKTPYFHLFDGEGKEPVSKIGVGESTRFTIDTDSVDHKFNSGDTRPSDLSMNPLKLFTQDKEEHIDSSKFKRDDKWEDSEFSTRGRILNDPVSRPYVDDFFRADDRWGPKPRYDSRNPSLDIANAPSGVKSGDDIDKSAYSALTGTFDGLDGYWERQAINSGLRLIVGQRLELGNKDGWGYDPRANSQVANGDPLYPPKAYVTTNGRFGGKNEHFQRKSLIDNLAAVQGMVVYHYEINSGKFPAACMAMTSHPGTRASIVNSRTFGVYPNTKALKVDFLNGNGTNGWEFAFPDAFDTETDFATAIGSAQPLGIALRNLANFAGDPYGGAPSFRAYQEADASTAGDEVHPAPYLSMWGDFSPLRRIFKEYLDNGVTYDKLSFADQSTLHSAACTLSMLAYNLKTEYQELSSLLSKEQKSLQSSSTQLRNAMDSIIGYLQETDPAVYEKDKIHDLFNNNFTDSDGVVRKFATVKPHNWAEDSAVVDTTCTYTEKVKGKDVTITDTTAFEKGCDVGQYFAEYSLNDWMVVLDQATNTKEEDIQAIVDFSNQFNYLSSSIRDRDLGFREGVTSKSLEVSAAKNIVTWDSATKKTEAVSLPVSGSHQFITNCNPNLFTDVIAKGTGGKDDQVALTLVTCSETDVMKVRYPSLYYLFPLVDHDHDGTGYHQQPDGVNLKVNPAQANNEPQLQGAEDYITNTYVKTINTGNYKVVGSKVIEGVGDIAGVPRANDSTLSNWVLPTSDIAAGSLSTSTIDNSDQAFSIAFFDSGTTPTSRVAKVTFLDKALLNGREQLNVRVLDVDLKALTTKKTSGGDYWLSADLDNPSFPAEGAVYAFREDAVREDEIVRPKTSTSGYDSAKCQELDRSKWPRLFRIEFDDKCYLNAGPTTFQDPPLTPRGISLKPVDFIPDPARRPYGFRLRTADGNPADFSGGNPKTGRQVGMTFVTNDSVYILGDFNPHTSDGTTSAGKILEEFDETLLDGKISYGAPFYKDRKTLNRDEFAILEKDHWRTVEILSDSLNILSGNYKDGAVSDAFTEITIDQGEDNARGWGLGRSSYTSLNRPEFTQKRDSATTKVKEPTYVLSDPKVTTGPEDSPVWFDRNGVFYLTKWYDKDGNEKTASPPEEFYDAFNNDNLWVRTADGNERRYNLQRAKQTYVNAVFVSGITPKRPKQSYGGLHNYPRFLEYWNDFNTTIKNGKEQYSQYNVMLFMQGSFIQLNFSAAATAPFEQEAWEPGGTPTDNEDINYYAPPARRWGFDVGLLYLPPAPAARRFVTVGSPRSEYFRQVASDDPYIKNLRCAKDKDGNRVLPAGVQGTCPT